MRTKNVLISTLFVLSSLASQAQVIPPAKIDLKDEGTSQGRVGQLDCVGSSVTCTRSGDTGTITVAAGGSVTATEFEIDFAACNFGPTIASYSCTKTVTDASVTATSKIMVTQSGIAASGSRPADENEMTPLSCRATPAAGTFLLTCVSLQGPANGKYKVNYLIG